MPRPARRHQARARGGAAILGVVVGTLGLIAFAGGAAAQWSALGLSGRYVQRLRAADGYLYACTWQGLYRKPQSSPDSTWTLLGFSGVVNDVLPVSTQELVVCKNAPGPSPDTIGVFLTTDGGTTWTPYQHGSVRPTSILAIPGTPVWLVAGCGIEKSVDGGLSWRRVSNRCLVRFLEMAPHASPRLWGGGENNILAPFMVMSADLGDTWSLQPVPGGGDNSTYAAAFHPTDPSIVLAGGELRVFRTLDGGASWHTVTSPQPPAYFNGMGNRAFAPMRVYATSRIPTFYNDVVIHRTDDMGDSWTQVSLPMDAGDGGTCLVVDSQPNADTIYVATGNGVYRYVETAIVGVPPVAIRPVGLSSRPNPFGAATSFRFTLDRRVHVRLEVIAADGRRVATILDEERAAGPHAVPWEAGDLPSGLYFARLQVGAVVTSLRMAHLR